MPCSLIFIFPYRLSNEILQAMRRKYSLKEFLDFVDKAHASVPNLCVGTDIMVGFGETDELFEQSCATFMDGPLLTAMFSPILSERVLLQRRKDHVTVSERKRRSAHLRRLSAMKRHEFHEAYLGREFPYYLKILVRALGQVHT